jgi:hypothetical protein
MFELRSENLTGLGGMMGTERTWTNFRKFYSSTELAKDAAEKDLGEKINWKKTTNGFNSGDLGHVMYHIKKVKVEK